MNEKFEPTLERYSLQGKYVLITGGGGLLGMEHTKAVCEIGATVVLTDISFVTLNLAKTQLEQSIDPKQLLYFEMDVTNPDSIYVVLRKLQQLNIQLDVLINNASIDPKVNDRGSSIEFSRLENFELSQWNLEVSVGLTGAFLCSKIFGTEMAQRGSGNIVNIASDLSVFSPDQRLYKKDHLPQDQQPVKPITYSAIKSGLVGMTRYLATYWADSGLRCNALSPGGVYVNQDDVFVKRISNLIPLGRMASRNEYHAAIQFLCTDASSYMTGQNLVIDGGRSAW